MAEMQPNLGERKPVLPGLLRPGIPNTVIDIPEKIHTDQERLERLVRESSWEHENVEFVLRERVPEAIQGQTALIIDGMGIPKSEKDSVGVARQWCGATGKIDNCQVTVNCTLARPGERQNADQLTWPLGMRLFLSEQWTGDDGQTTRANKNGNATPSGGKTHRFLLTLNTSRSPR